MNPADPAAVRQSAEQHFAAGLYCSESVVLALAQARGIDSELLPKAATAFGGGMARTCGTCGALTGAVMGVGLALGRSSAADSVNRSFAATQRLVRAFEAEFGSRDCRTLLGGCDLDTPDGQAMFKRHKLGRRCVRFTGRAAELAAQAIADAG